MMYVHFEHDDGQVLNLTTATLEEALDAVGNEVAAILENGNPEDNVGVFPIHFYVRAGERTLALGMAFETGQVATHIMSGESVSDLPFDVTDDLIPD